MLKVAIYCHHLSKPVDFSKVNEGNPGIGGTEYCFSLLMSTLALYFSNRLKIVFFSMENFHQSDLFECRQVDTLNHLYSIAENEKFDFVLLRTDTSLNFFYNLKKSSQNVKLILWSHNYFNAHIASLISKESRIIANVFVSKQMYDFYYDHDVIKKSTYIFNPVVDAQGYVERSFEPHTAVYMGSIVKDKGILQLLKLWQYVIKKYPDAVLNIIGTGTIYSSSNIQVGSLGIASENLEKQMLPYICDDKGKVKENYKLLGLLGKEKYEVFKRCAVGIVNPSAKTETFGLGIIEMATTELPVVTKCWNAHLDTIINGKTGLMALSLRGMSNCIMKLFENDDLNIRLGRAAKERVVMYSPKIIAQRWFELFERLKSGNRIERLEISSPWWNNYKILRWVNSKLRFKLKLSFLPSIVDLETLVNDMLKKVR